MWKALTRGGRLSFAVVAVACVTLLVCDRAALAQRAASAAEQPPATQPAVAAAPPDTAGAPVSPSGQSIEQIILDLENESFDARKTASLRLNSLGGDALPKVEAALEAGVGGAESKIRLEAAARILRARARVETAERARVAWKHKRFLESYQNHGDRHPRWDAHVEKGFEQFLKLGGDPAAGPQEPRRLATEAFGAALDAGCDDPLVRFIHQLAVGDRGRMSKGALTYSEAQALAVQQLVSKTQYPAVMKFWAVWRCIRLADGDDFFFSHRISGLIQSAAKLFPEIAQTPGLPANELDVNAQQLYDAMLNRGRNMSEYAGVLKAYEAARPGAPGPLIMKARMLIDEANWSRRRTGGKGADEKVDEAEKLLEQAWKLDPSAPRPPTLMITVKTVQDRWGHNGIVIGGNQGDGGTRDAMETWFARAMEASPDNYDACLRKLNYLSGSWTREDAHQEMLEFGRWCAATENWRAGIPFILAEVHERIAPASDDRKEYYARPEVWEDLRGVYEGCVLNFPNAHLQRNRYAKIAAQCGQWMVAHEQFQALASHARPEVFGGEATMNYLKRKAARLAAAEQDAK